MKASDCHGLKKCKELNFFKPSFRRGLEREDEILYNKMRRVILNAEAKVDCKPSKMVLKRCESEDRTTLSLKFNLDRMNKQIASSLLKQYMVPCLVDCWNDKYLDHLLNARTQSHKQDYKRVADSTKINLQMMSRCNGAQPRYCRYKQLQDWEAFMAKTTPRYNHEWKDPFYTTQVLTDKSIVKPVKKEEHFWINYPDNRMLSCRGGLDWDAEEMRKMLAMLDKINCQQCPGLCE